MNQPDDIRTSNANLTNGYGLKVHIHAAMQKENKKFHGSKKRQGITKRASFSELAVVNIAAYLRILLFP